MHCGYSLELLGRGGSNEYPQSYFEQKYEKNQKFLSEKYFLVVKFSVYLNRHVFVMTRSGTALFSNLFCRQILIRHFVIAREYSIS